MSTPHVISRLLDLRREHIVPAAQAHLHTLAPESCYTSPPTILMLGNHSSGKSSMINHLLGKGVQRTGIAPTDDAFTVLFYSEEERNLEGRTLITRQDMPFADLAQYGPGLGEHLRGKGLPANLLQHVRLIDSPGMIDSGNSQAKRPYDFPQVVKYFAAQADLVLLFFDPEKPGTTGETIAILTEALTGIDHKLRIVMNKMDLFEGMRDFARTYGALCWNLSRNLPTKDLPHIYTTVIPSLTRANPQLPLDGFHAALRELEAHIADLPNRRVDTLISLGIDEARQLHLRSVVVEAYRRSVRRSRWLTLLIGMILALLLGGAAFIGHRHFDMGLLPVLGILASGAVALIASAWLMGPIARISERRGSKRLDHFLFNTHRQRFATGRPSEDLHHDWMQVKPMIEGNLAQVGLSGIGIVSRKQRTALEHLWRHELPTLRQR
ncbi:MAG: GTPase [Planctomycetota bacterium]|nr:MAG: GTPase [Planctomycetota bacterium]